MIATNMMHLMLWFQKKHILFGQFDAFTDVILISIMFKCVFSTYRPEEPHDQVKFQLTNDSTESLTKNKFIPAINLRQLAIIEFKPPSNDKVFRVLYMMGYLSNLKGVADFRKGRLPTIGKYFCHYII
ncbi:unnamed protein product [Lactuca saligna]|uniref:Uncharacterized protein n=1 Tax=Lactuca saligna TaxID=75948 RepID=A0AA35V4S3_LACSI|nr:unnamed protein product [Lactuca saligna]